MVKVLRGQVWWADLPDPSGSGPGFRRPVLIIQSDDFNRSNIQTVIVVAITSNSARAKNPGNVYLSASESGRSKDSVLNISQVQTLEKVSLSEAVSMLSRETMDSADAGLRMVLGLNQG